jgi:hypothetical protein
LPVSMVVMTQPRGVEVAAFVGWTPLKLLR